MKRIEKAALIGLSLWLTACSPALFPHRKNGILVRDNAYGPVPPGARIVSNDDFVRGVEEGRLKLLSPKTAREAALAQFRQDVETLSAIPERDRSPHVRSILEAMREGVDPFVEEVVEVRDPEGREASYRLLSLAVDARAAVEAERLAADPENALTAYRLAYDAAPASARIGLPVPDDLAERPLAEIEAARARLGVALSREPRLDDVLPEPPRPELAFTPSPGKGSDGTVSCPKSASGIHRNFWWPLKDFVSPIRNQAKRGTCWVFSALAALESRELVVNDRDVNLSEQYFNYRWKSTWSIYPHKEGDFSLFALSFMVSFPGAASAIPPEDYWTYNPSTKRIEEPPPLTNGFAGSCDDYTGTCSETISQGPVDCTKVNIFPGFSFDTCGVQIFVYEGTDGVPSAHATQVWKSGQGLDLGTLRAYLSNGHALLAEFDVYRGFQNAGATDGFVVDYAKLTGENKKKGGAHEVLFIGFIANEDLAQQLPDAPPGDGGGYFVAKNSWSCSGDGGFHYVPVTYVKAFFKRLSLLQISNQRGQGWQTAKSQANQGPRLRITKPFPSSDVLLEPERVDFQKEIVLEATATDLQDGPDCCADTFEWTAGSLPLGTGASVKLSPDMLKGLSETKVQVTGQDNDGNQATARLWLADIVPTIKIGKPLPNQTLVAGQASTFQGQVWAEGVGTLDCSALRWRGSAAGDPVALGCSPTLTFSTEGDRDVLVDWDVAGRVASAQVPVKVVKSAASGPPTVALLVKNAVGPNGNAIVKFTFSDPGGPGEADRSQYKLAWELEYEGVRKTIAPKNFLGRPDEVLILSRAEFAPDSCTAPSPSLTVHLSITDPESLTGKATTSFTYSPPPCIH